MIHDVDKFPKSFIRDIHQFKDWYLSKPRSFFPITSGVRTMELLAQDEKKAAIDAVIFRQGRFQVQLFSFPGNCIVPEHLHPNIRSYECYLGGDISFSKDKVWHKHMKCSEHYDIEDRLLYISENTWHGGLTGPAGGMFMSIQEWLNGVNPSCVSKDWKGIACIADQLVESETNEFTLTDKINWQDAASMEDDKE